MVQTGVISYLSSLDLITLSLLHFTKHMRNESPLPILSKRAPCPCLSSNPIFSFGHSIQAGLSAVPSASANRRSEWPSNPALWRGFMATPNLHTRPIGWWICAASTSHAALYFSCLCCATSTSTYVYVGNLSLPPNAFACGLAV